jgi:hypothetical protein
MERRVRGNPPARCGVGEKLEIASKAYLSLYESERKLLIFHEPSGKQKVMKFGSKELARFLEAHNVTLQECKKVKRDKDRLGLFKCWRSWFK